MQTHIHTYTNAHNYTFVTTMQQQKRKYVVCCTNTTDNTVQYNYSFPTIRQAQFMYNLLQLAT